MTTNPGLLKPETLTEKAPEVYDVTFSTTKGDFIVHVNRAWAPVGADRFYNLVKAGYPASWSNSAWAPIPRSIKPGEMRKLTTILLRKAIARDISRSPLPEKTRAQRSSSLTSATTDNSTPWASPPSVKSPRAWTWFRKFTAATANLRTKGSSPARAKPTWINIFQSSIASSPRQFRPLLKSIAGAQSAPSR
jgi:hypothetical protein